ncbi:hypothetical protein Tco_0910868 [Tanacetum coccineum]|uniref:Uncharacterized protein n=1 Tax=Tanacetum coccineum TaxID=301880 RepID=A0ABQ5CUJ0_9ASTR
MSTPDYVNSESITQTDGAQSSRVSVPLPDDPYVAVRQARLVDTESEPEEAPAEAEELQSLGSRVPLMVEEFEAVEPSGTRTDSSHSSASLDSTAPLSPDHLLTHVSPTPTPTRASFHRRTTRMTVRVQPDMSPGHSARVTEVMALSGSAFRKRYRSSYESPSSSLSLALLVWKRYQGTSELILDTDSEGYELGDEDIEEDKSSDMDDKGERLDDKGHGSDDEGRSLEGEGLSLEEEGEAAPEDQQQAVSVVDTATSEPLVAPVQTPISPEWSSGSLPVSPSSPVVPSPIASPVATPTATISVDHKLYTRSGVVRDEIFSQRYRFRSLEREQERTTVTFRALWRLVLALEAWARHVDTRMADMSRAGYDDHRLIYDMLVQQAALQHELRETRDRVTALEQERDRREQ